MFESFKMRLLERLRRYFPGAKQQREAYTGSGGFEQRDFDRYPVSFPVRISGKDKNRSPFEEESRLQDVSGNGAMFITRYPDRYYPGQLLQLSILLDAAEDVQACISNEAAVVRIHPHHCELSDPSGLAGIAVRFHYTFDFERVDPGHGW
ncbi:MAG: PilZ domain-containing protein [Desulfobacteraceae bacterium]|nr:PilZ domain-containing protein [Desulfobacteraceae bacterium]